jgi:glycosyltransferase involved in cell wall biosynthesis
MITVSVVICSHNPRVDYLSRVLEALRNQSLPVTQWELLLIDNASKEPLAATWDISWHPNARHIVESELGLANARQMGIQQAAASTLVFVDDDNVLESDYLSEVLKIGHQWPRLGIWGSNSISGKFEISPSKDLEPYLPYLALRDAKATCWTNVATCREALPCDAGLCIRANVAKAYAQIAKQSSIKISGRSGSSLFGEEDHEIAYVACKMGLGMGLFPELRVMHLIPKERVAEDYLVRLYESSEVSNYILGYKWQGILPPNPLTPLGFLAVSKNVFTRDRVQRRMYFALMRAALKARHTIIDNQSKISGIAM